MALRNRWRRQRLSHELREEVTPKNILMIGPTGCGKTEISRRLAKLADAPFVKVEATKFTEVGYVGRDVEQIARDLVEEAVRLERERRREAVREAAEDAAMDRLLDALTGKGSSEATRASFRQRFADGSLDNAEVEIEVSEAPAMPFDMPGNGRRQMINLGEMMGKAFGKPPTKRRKLKVREAFARLTEEEGRQAARPRRRQPRRAGRCRGQWHRLPRRDRQDRGFSDVRGGSVSREGVQRDLLPLIEGTTVATKYGPIKTDHILFIASGAFHVAKPSDLLPELQGRLPIRVELKALTEEDFVRILSSTRASLTEQYQALLATEQVTVNFAADGIAALARIAAQVNGELENIGARRLQTVMEKLLEDISFEAEDRSGRDADRRCGLCRQAARRDCAERGPSAATCSDRPGRYRHISPWANGRPGAGLDPGKPQAVADPAVAGLDRAGLARRRRRRRRAGRSRDGRCAAGGPRGRA